MFTERVTPTWADIPNMPWKTAPTTGHIMGTITNSDTGAWADGATVSVTGPVNRTMTADGTGFYAFIDLPPGSYTVTVTNLGYFDAEATVNVAVGEVTGNMYEQDFSLVPAFAPTITMQPLDQTVSPGSNAVFTVAATGTPPLSYQWRFYGAEIPGATDTTYTRTNAQIPDMGPYSVVVSNVFGAATSTNAMLDVLTAPVILSQPQSVAITAGQSAQFTVTAGGAPPLAYQWRFNGADLAGETANTLTLAAPLATDGGAYSVLVTNTNGAALSADALLTFMPGAVGDNSFDQGVIPVSAKGVIAVSAGTWNTVALRADGTALAWGDNSRGQCEVPPGLEGLLAIAAGRYHGLAIRADRTVVSWGAGDYGQTTVPAGLTNVIAIAAGSWHSVALRGDGTVAAWGDDSFGQSHVPAGLSNVTAIAAGGNHTLALKADGTVAAWGENTDPRGNITGQSVVPQGLTDVVAIAAGDYHSLAVKRDGTVVAWGADFDGQCEVPSGLTGVAAVAGGGSHSLALQADGSVAAWGANWSGQCNIPAAYQPAVAIAAGGYHSVVLLEGTMPVARLMAGDRSGDRFSTLIQTLSRKHYALEYKPSLDATNWTAVCTNAGNGALSILTDSTAAGAQRFYRMRQW